jgi:hypothetical protein
MITIDKPSERALEIIDPIRKKYHVCFKDFQAKIRYVRSDQPSRHSTKGMMSARDTLQVLDRHRDRGELLTPEPGTPPANARATRARSACPATVTHDGLQRYKV